MRYSSSATLRAAQPHLAKLRAINELWSLRSTPSGWTPVGRIVLTFEPPVIRMFVDREPSTSTPPDNCT
jgi:hypothetical protein